MGQRNKTKVIPKSPKSPRFKLDFSEILLKIGRGKCPDVPKCPEN
jgi:hypothetical protein